MLLPELQRGLQLSGSRRPPASSLYARSTQNSPKYKTRRINLCRPFVQVRFFFSLFSVGDSRMGLKLQVVERFHPGSLDDSVLEISVTLMEEARTLGRIPVHSY